MILLIIGLLTAIWSMILMSICEIKSSVFPKLGFQDSDIEIWDINFIKYIPKEREV